MTLGPALCALAALEGRRLVTALRPLVVLGRVPLFYFVAHLAVLRALAAVLALARWGPGAFQPPPGHAGSPQLPLWGAYLGWAATVALLFPLCRRFAALKDRRASPWLSYF
jgi:hypothetical protein